VLGEDGAHLVVAAGAGGGAALGRGAQAAQVQVLDPRLAHAGGQPRLGEARPARAATARTSTSRSTFASRSASRKRGTVAFS
jgi:hypothetical protein